MCRARAGEVAGVTQERAVPQRLLGQPLELLAKGDVVVADHVERRPSVLDRRARALDGALDGRAAELAQHGSASAQTARRSRS